MAFIVNGLPITVAQRDAGWEAMVGVFSRHDVARALRNAGVINLPGQVITVERTVDRLLQNAKKRGEIRIATDQRRGMWERFD